MRKITILNHAETDYFVPGTKIILVYEDTTPQIKIDNILKWYKNHSDYKIISDRIIPDIQYNNHQSTNEEANPSLSKKCICLWDELYANGCKCGGK